MRFASFALLVSCALPAAASYELLLLPDFSTGKIVRYDPTNNVGLGSFGLPMGVATRSFVNYRSNGTAYYTNDQGTSSYDMATGVLINSATFPDSRTRISAQGGRMLEATASTLFVTNPDDLSQPFSTAIPNSVSVVSLVPYSNDLWRVVFRNTAGGMDTVNYNAATNTVGTAISLFTGASSAHGMGQSVLNGTSMSHRFTYRNSTNQLVLVTATSSNGTSFSLGQNTLSGVGNFGATATIGMLPAHSGFYLVGDDATDVNLTRISFMREGALSPIATWTTTAVNVPTQNWGGYSIVAPEPGSLLVMMAGGLALLRRRRSA